MSTCGVTEWPRGEISQELILPNNTVLQTRAGVCYEKDVEGKGNGVAKVSKSKAKAMPTVHVKVKSKGKGKKSM